MPSTCIYATVCPCMSDTAHTSIAGETKPWLLPLASALWEKDREWLPTWPSSTPVAKRSRKTSTMSFVEPTPARCLSQSQLQSMHYVLVHDHSHLKSAPGGPCGDKQVAVHKDLESKKGVLCRHAHAHIGYKAQRRWLTSLDAPRYLSAAEQGFYVSVHFHCSHHGLRSSIPGYSMCLVKAWLSPMGAETKAPACSKTVPLVLHQGVCLDPGSTFTRKEGQRKAGLCTLRLDNRRSSPSLVCYAFWLSVTAHNAMATTAHNRTAVPEQ